MPQTTDITIDGAGYMIEPGTYKRHQDGMAEGRTERIAITDFFGGQNRALQLERDKFAASINIGPALDGQGVRPWAKQTTVVASAITGTLPQYNTEIPYAIIRDRLWFAIGASLYKGPLVTPGAAWSLTQVRTFANTIVDLCIYGSSAMLITYGSSADILFYDTLTATEAVLFTTERGSCIEAYAGHAVWSDARTTSRPTILRHVTGTGFDDRGIDYDPIKITTLGGELCVVTKQALYTFTGRVKEVTKPGASTEVIDEWTGEWTPFFQQGVYNDRDDFKMLLGYGGRTIAWIAGGVHELKPSGDRAGWNTIGLSGKRCFGGCVAAGYVIVSIESHGGDNELWAYDGNGWWLFYRAVMTASPLCWPMPIGANGTNSTNVMLFTSSSNTTQQFTLIETDNDYPLAITGEFYTPMIDVGERDKAKAWRKVGAVFASPDLYHNTASIDDLRITFDYSIDGGATWVTAFTAPSADWAGIYGVNMAAMNFSLDEALSGVASKFLMLRIKWTSVSDWAPILVGVWAEYEVLDSPARRRKWDMKIHARDQEIDRDGVLLTRTGRQLVTDLWDAWSHDTTVTFRDIDYDDAPVQRTVRIVGISEAVAQPADSNLWGDSTIQLKLVEV